MQFLQAGESLLRSMYLFSPQDRRSKSPTWQLSEDVESLDTQCLTKYDGRLYFQFVCKSTWGGGTLFNGP